MTQDTGVDQAGSQTTKDPHKHENGTQVPMST